jgi:glycosyltransferase involved in cell wall biosynthesis
VHYHSDHAAFGGCETMLVNLLSQPEIRRDYTVSFSYRESPRYAAELRRRIRIDFPVYPLPFMEPSSLVPAVHRWRPPFDRVGRVLSRQLTTLPALLHEIVTLCRLLRRLGPDVLHINNGGYPGALSARAAAIAGRLAGVPHVIMVVNNYAEGYDGVCRKLQYPIDRLVVRSVSRFISGSAAAATRVREVLGLASRQAVSIVQGADLRTPSETPDTTRARVGIGAAEGLLLGIVALLEPRKGHRVLIEAIARVRAASTDATPPFTVLFVGDGPMRAELEALAAERDVAEQCRFLGYEENPMNVMAILDVLVLASVGYEDFPNVVLEAMAVGKAVIASRMAGTPEQIVDGETGLLVTPGNVDELAAAMSRLLLDAPLRRAMGTAGRRRFEERFTAARAARRYAEFYRALLDGRETART